VERFTPERVLNQSIAWPAWRRADWARPRSTSATRRKSVLHAENTKTLTPARASGAVAAATTPTASGSYSPRISRHRYPPRVSAPAGASPSAQTMVISRLPRVMETNRPLGQAGRGASGERRAKANTSGKMANLINIMAVLPEDRIGPSAFGRRIVCIWIGTDP